MINRVIFLVQKIQSCNLKNKSRIKVKSLIKNIVILIDIIKYVNHSLNFYLDVLLIEENTLLKNENKNFLAENISLKKQVLNLE